MKKLTTERQQEQMEGEEAGYERSTGFEDKDPRKDVPKYIIVPDSSTFKTYWDILAAAFLLVSLVFIPYT